MNDARAPKKPLLVLDFDGTVCIGDAPVWAYAEAVIASILDDASGSSVDLDAPLRARLGAFLDGEPGSPAYIDGYAAVAALAAGHASEELLQRAYRTSRRALADGTVAVSAPDGLAAFLNALGERVERVLVTNAPLDGVQETLSAIGLADSIDRIVTDAGKPAGWATALPELLAGRLPAELLSVGDIWGNDLEQPLAAGCVTALIDRFGHRAGPAHLTASDFPGLYDGIRAWSADPVGFAEAHRPTASSTLTA
ncbi:HAD family hydrolase [Leifsonia poae]|uniref:HAD family hydrolase n=1 Tax=Leifsonia poae TaxID=110933 RepID=UPI001CBC648F|nr:HAD family hydrolase [Leifsonia poae]